MRENNLKKLRNAAGFKQREVADILNYRRQTISKWETGENEPSIEDLKKLSKLYNVNIECFYGENNTIVDESEETFDPSVKEDNSIENEMDNLIDLAFADNVDISIKLNCAGVLESTGSEERVTYAIAGITGYLRGIVNMKPKAREHTQALVDSIVIALSNATIDVNNTSIEAQWPYLKNNISTIVETVELSEQSQKEAYIIIDKMIESRLSNDNLKKQEVIKLTLFWIGDSWSQIYMNNSAYSALSHVCCMLSGAATDFQTRQNIVTSINSFSSLIKIYQYN